MAAWLRTRLFRSWSLPSINFPKFYYFGYISRLNLAHTGYFRGLYVCVETSSWYITIKIKLSVLKEPFVSIPWLTSLPCYMTNFFNILIIDVRLSFPWILFSLSCVRFFWVSLYQSLDNLVWNVQAICTLKILSSSSHCFPLIYEISSWKVYWTLSTNEW